MNLSLSDVSPPPVSVIVQRKAARAAGGHSGTGTKNSRVLAQSPSRGYTALVALV